MKNYDEKSALVTVAKNKSIQINYSNRQLEIDKQGAVGNGTWGKIDFLTKYCGWTWIKIDRAQKREEEAEKRRKRFAKKAANHTNGNHKRNGNNAHKGGAGAPKFDKVKKAAARV